MPDDNHIYDGQIGAHTRLRTLSPVIDIDPTIRLQIFGDYLDNVIQTWNDLAPLWLQLCRLPTGPMRIAMLRPYLNSTAVTDLCEMTLTGTPEKAPGYFLFPDKIKAVIVLFMALEAGHIKVAFDAETQWGKTIVLIMLFLMRNLWLRSCTTRSEIIMLFGLPRNAPDDQTSEDRKAATLLHAVFSFTNATSTAYDLKNATDQHQNLLNRTDDDANQLKRVRTVLPQSDEDDTRLSIAVNLATKQHASVTVLMDEGDAGTNVKGVYDRIVQYLEEGVKMCMVLISATSYQYRWIKEFHQIACEIDDHNTTYCGTVRGHLTPLFSFSEIATRWRVEHIDLVRPKLFYSEEQFTALQAKLDARQERAQKRCRRAPSTLDDPLHGMTHAEYRAFCGARFLALIDRLINDPPIGEGLLGKPLNGGLGIMLRFGTTKEQQIDFSNMIKDELLARYNLHVVPFYGNHLKRKKFEPATVKSHIKRHLDDRGATSPYMVCVVHAARRSDRFPNDTTIFIDFTELYSTMQAMEQGTMGRVSGFKWSDMMRAIVLLSNRNARLVRLFRKLYEKYQVKMPIIRPAIGAISVEGVTMRRIKVLTLDFDKLRHHPDIGAVICRIEQQIDTMITRHIVVGERNNKAGRVMEFTLRGGTPQQTKTYRTVARGWTEGEAGKLTWYFPFFQQILTPKVLETIETWVAEGSIGDVEIMRPDREYHLDRLAKDPDVHDNWVQVAVGNYYRSTSQSRNLTQYVDTSMRKYHGPAIRAKRDTEGEERVPNALFEQLPNRKLRPKSLSLTLANFIFPFSIVDRESRSNHIRLMQYAKSFRPSSVTLPIPKDMWHAKITDEEREAVDRALKIGGESGAINYFR